MRKLRCIALSFVGALLLSPILFIAFYDCFYFRPYLPSIRATYLALTDEDRETPRIVDSVVRRIYGRSVESQLSRELLWDLKVPHRSMLSWHIQSVMWDWLLRLHLSEKERMALYCHYLLYEEGRGLRESAQYHFSKSPRELSQDEVLGLLAIDVSPRSNSPQKHPDRFQQERQRLKDRYNRTND